MRKSIRGSALVVGIVVLIVIAISIFMAIRIMGLKNKNVVVNNGEKIVPVTTQEITRSDLVLSMDFFGTVKAFNQIDAYAKIQGRVEELLTKNGAEVKSGEVLATLEHSAITAQIEQATASREATTAQLKQLNINLANLEKELNRIRELSKEGAVSESRKDQIETQFNAMLAQKEVVEAQVRQLEAILQQARINMDEASIKAPISGIISQKYIDIGDMVTPQRPVFTVIQIERVKITTTIPETILSQVKAGESHTIVRVDTYPDKSFDGVVTYVAPSVDPRNRTAEIEIEMDNKDNLLKTGMFCRIELTIENKKNIIAIPKDRLVYDITGNETKGFAVYVIRGNIAKKTLVQIGIYSRGLVEIKEGLIEGDQIISTIGPQIYDGCKVEVVNERAEELKN